MSDLAGSMLSSNRLFDDSTCLEVCRDEGILGQTFVVEGIAVAVAEVQYSSNGHNETVDSLSILQEQFLQCPLGSRWVASHKDP